MSPIERAIALAAALAIIGVARWIRFRRQLDRIEASVRKLRELASRRIEYRRVERDDPQLAFKIVALDDLNGELAAADVTVLGDAVGSHEPQPTRWFVDRAGTTIGWCAALEHRGRRLRVAIAMSRAGERVFITRRTKGTVALAQPPFTERQVLPLDTSLADVLASHRQLAGDPEKLERFTTLEAATAELERLREQTARWRDQQPVGQLLDADLRAILGRHYAALAPRLAKRFEIELPQARVV